MDIAQANEPPIKKLSVLFSAEEDADSLLESLIESSAYTSSRDDGYAYGFWTIQLSTYLYLSARVFGVQSRQLHFKVK